MILAQKQKYRSIVQDRNPKINSQTCVTQSMKKEVRIYTMQKVSSTSDIGITGYLHVKEGD